MEPEIQIICVEGATIIQELNIQHALYIESLGIPQAGKLRTAQHMFQHCAYHAWLCGTFVIEVH
jgi:hypothetical protein